MGGRMSNGLNFFVQDLQSHKLTFVHIFDKKYNFNSTYLKAIYAQNTHKFDFRKWQVATLC
jgi:hypothetical protein